jgi:catechol 2,3-dioxygenase-like lactoylglutathione lyase family enzyme
MLGNAELVAFVPSTDRERSRAFYVEVLGLELVDSTPFADVLEAAGTTLRVTVVDGLAPQPFTVLGWEVRDLGAEVMELADRGVTFERFEGMDQDALGIWQTPSGDRVAWFKDPDANVLSLTQLALLDELDA